jgi:hypothetical protein
VVDVIGRKAGSPRRRGGLRIVIPVAALTVAVGLSAAPSAAGVGAKPVDPSKLAWTRSPAGAPGAGNLNALASNGKLFVVGGLASGGGPGAPIWTSSDGLTWTQAKASATDFPAGSIVIDAVYDGKRFIAFGQPGSGGAGTLAWTSSDGKSWKRYRGKGFPAEPTGNPVAAARTKGGLLLLVRDASDVHSVWSARGDTWKSLGPVPAAGVSDVFLSRAVPEPSGKGYVVAGQQSRDATAWTSANGSQWDQEAVSTDAQGFESIHYVVDGGPGLVAVGVANGPDGNEIASAWISKDGAQWQPVDGGQEFAAQPGKSAGIDVAVRNDKSVLAAGHDGDKLALWTSTNGTTWKRVPDDPNFQIRSGTAALASGVVAANGRVVTIFRERRFTGTNFQLVGVGIVAGKAK